MVTPGPMVELKVIPFMYAPLAPAGLAFATASTNALTFSISCSSLKDALPTPA